MESLPQVEEQCDRVLNDEAFKEMSDQLMEKFKETEYLTQRVTRENLDLKKSLMVLYGLIKSIDVMVDGCSNLDPAVTNVIEVARTMASSFIHDYCLECD